MAKQSFLITVRNLVLSEFGYCKDLDSIPSYFAFFSAFGIDVMWLAVCGLSAQYVFHIPFGLLLFIVTYPLIFLGSYLLLHSAVPKKNRFKFSFLVASVILYLFALIAWFI